jgi:hypothetical protein
MASTAIPNAINAAPNGRAYGTTDFPLFGDPSVPELLMETRNSCTRAIWNSWIEYEERDREDAPTPADAKARLVRTYARKVRSDARWSRATEPVFCRVRESLNGIAVARTRSGSCLGEDIEPDGGSRWGSAALA